MGLKSLLQNVSPEKAFWVHNGPILKSVTELVGALKSMSEDTFRHHVSRDKNDFATWINDVYGEQKLASQVRGAGSKTALQSLLRRSLK